MKKLFIIILVLTATVFSQRNFLTVYSVTGNVKYQKVSTEKIRKLSGGEKLYSGMIMLQDNSSIQLVNPESKAKILDKPGEYNVSSITVELQKQESKSVFQRLMDFILNKMDATKDKKYGLATIEGAINKSSLDNLELYFPNSSTLLLSNYEFNWENTGKNNTYTFSITSGIDTVFKKKTTETNMRINIQDLNIADSDSTPYYFILSDNYGTESKKKTVYFISEGENKYVENMLNEISASNKEIAADESENIWARATFLELNNLIYDAYLEYQHAIKFSNKSQEYLILFQEFLQRYSLKTELE